MNLLRRLPRILAFAGYYVTELLRANLRLAHAILFARRRLRPGIIAVPLQAHGDGALLLLTNLTTMTPGTLSLEVSADRRVLYVHTMFAEDPDALRREIQDELERRVQEVCA